MPSYSPYDWNESIQQRNEYIEDRLKDGSPVAAVRYDGGLLVVSVRQNQRKVYEIYDRLMFSAIGNQSDVEQIRVAAVDVAHAEGFQRSPDDVSVQRLVGMRISPAIKKVYSDSFAQPIVFKGIFAELGKTADRDQLLLLSYDGEFSSSDGIAVVAGTVYAEDRMRDHIKGAFALSVPTLSLAMDTCIMAWGIGRKHLDSEDRADADYAADSEGPEEISTFLAKHLKEGWIVEAGVLERDTNRESRFRLLDSHELSHFTEKYLS